VKENDLQNKVNGQIINPNDELKKLLNVGEDDKLTYFNIQKFMNRHFHKASLTPPASDGTPTSAPTLQTD
jgi:chromatin remodeling complex protein RSC6